MDCKMMNGMGGCALLIGCLCGCATGPAYRPERCEANRFVGRDAEWVFANFGMPDSDYIKDRKSGLGKGLYREYEAIENRVRFLSYRRESLDAEAARQRFALIEDADIGWRVIDDWGNFPLQNWNTQSLHRGTDDDIPDTWDCAYTGHDEAWIIAKFGKPDRCAVRTASWLDRTVYLIEEFEEHDERTRFKELWYRKHEQDPEFILYLKENENGKWIVVADILVPHGIQRKREEEQKW